MDNKKRRNKTIEFVGIFSSTLGLYFSDNKTAIVLVFVLALTYIYLKLFKDLISFKPILFFILLSFTGFVVFLLNGASYEFVSDSIISQSNVFQYDSVYSSYLRLINTGKETGTLFNNVFGFFSAVAFFLNRSEMWGLFFTRYNPTFMELLFGSGPMNFGQLYGEIIVNNPSSTLLPHSSMLFNFIYWCCTFYIFNIYIFNYFN